jgi:opacity protein-like surface antigen
MKKKTYVVGVAVVLVALLSFSGVAKSAMWFGAELGGNFPMSPDLKVTGFNFGGAGYNFGGAMFRTAVIGGATLGYDFVNSGFGAYAWPDWMKYFSIATDITYNSLNVLSIGGANIPTPVRGYCVAWTFLFMAHYGFFPDSEIPSGRVNPYIGVGPAIIWSGIDLGPFVLAPCQLRALSGSSTNIGFVLEPGIRWMAFKQVSIDTSFRYRLASPTYDIRGVDFELNPLHQLSFLVRANYHF